MSTSTTNDLQRLTTDELGFGEVNSIEFAIYVTQLALKRGNFINTTRLQKWVYICYGSYLHLYRKQLLTETPKAWQYGPFFPEIHSRQLEYKGTLSGLIPLIDQEKFKKYDPLITDVLEHFGHWTAEQLVEWTHEENRAWFKKYHSEGGRFTALDNEDILSDFSEYMNSDASI